MGTYLESLKDPRWQKKRLEIFERDQWTCRECMSSDDTLHVHHILYESSLPWETSDKFLITLCEKCHEDEEKMKGLDFYPITQRVGLTRQNTYRILKCSSSYFSLVDNIDCYAVADFILSIKASESSIALYNRVKAYG